MRECKRHPSQLQHGSGVCASCLRERLVRLWRGQSFHLDDDNDELASTGAENDDGDAPPARASSLTGVRLQLQVNGVAKPEPAAAETPNVMVEWTEFHAQRRRRSSEQDTAKIGSRSLDSLELKPLVERLVTVADADAAARPRAIRSRSMPMHNRRAEETARRVIRELQGSDDELAVVGLKTPEQQRQQRQQQQQRCRQCGIWFLSNSPRWVAKLVAPARNKQKVFLSRVGSKKRLTRFNSADWSQSGASGVPRWLVASAVPAKEGARVDADARQRRAVATVASMRSSVFSWLQDADRTMIRNYDSTRPRSFPGSASESTQVRPQDLTTVGHLHEIAEELEIVEDSDFENGDGDGDGNGYGDGDGNGYGDGGGGAAAFDDAFRDIASFGNFLRSAALKHPHAHLTRLASAA